MKELTAFDINALVKEAQFLVSGKIDNIYQTDEKNIYLQIYIKDKPKQLLRVFSGKCFYLTKNRPEFPENLQRFCSFLRKFILNSRIRKFEQIGHERILRIILEAKEGTYELISEFFGKGNIVLVKNNKIISVSEEQIWADRILKSGEKYIYPNKTDSNELFEKQKLKGSAVTMQLLDEELFKEEKSKKPLSSKEKELQKIKVIIDKQSEQLGKILNEVEENKRKGELIYEQYQELQDLIGKTKNIEKLKKSKLFKELKNGKLVVEIK